MTAHQIQSDSALITPVTAARRTARRQRRAGFLQVIARHVLGSLGVVWGVITATFLVTRVFAPDPTTLFLGGGGNGYASAAAEAAARAKVQARLGLNTSIPHQYWTFIDDLLHGNLGTSFETGRSVSSDLASRLPATAELAVYALILGVLCGVSVGVLAAVRRGGIFDHLARLGTIGGMALPQFWIGLVLLWIFTTTLHITPAPIGRLPTGVHAPPTVTGFYVIDALLSGEWNTAGQAFMALLLPVITLAIGLAAPIAKVVRTSMLEALSSDYVRTARALGFGDRRILFAYALKNALLPVVTLLAGIIAYTFVGSILVEGIFGWPGVGNYAYQAIQNSDFPAIQGFVVYSAILYVLVYELLEIVYWLVDPRVRA